MRHVRHPSVDVETIQSWGQCAFTPNTAAEIVRGTQEILEQAGSEDC